MLSELSLCAVLGWAHAVIYVGNAPLLRVQGHWRRRLYFDFDEFAEVLRIAREEASIQSDVEVSCIDVVAWPFCE